MKEFIKAFCPEDNQDKEIVVTYVNSGTYKIKGLFECHKAAFAKCEYYKKNGTCPIYEQMPNFKKD